MKSVPLALIGNYLLFRFNHFRISLLKKVFKLKTMENEIFFRSELMKNSSNSALVLSRVLINNKKTKSFQLRLRHIVTIGTYQHCLLQVRPAPSLN